jgi:hypothetical protein
MATANGVFKGVLMPTKEMLLVLNTLDNIKRKGILFQSQANNLGYVTFEEIQLFQQFAQRGGALGQIATALISILEKSEDHPDLPGELASVAGLFLAWSLQLSKPLEENRFVAGDKVRVRFPGRGLVYLGTVIEEENVSGTGRLLVALPMLGTMVPLSEVHVQEKIAKPKPKASEVAEFQKLLHGKLEEILQTVQQ